MTRHCKLQAVNIIVVILLLAVLITNMVTAFSPANADDSSSKISNDIYKAVGGMTGRPHLQVQSILQGEAGEPGNITIFLYMNGKPDASQVADLATLGVIAYPDSWIPPVGAHPQGFLIASVPVSKLYTLAQKSYIVRLEYAEKQAWRQNDVAVTTINAQTAWAGGYTGSGVRVAVLDDGLDVTHPDFPSPVFAKDYWNYPAIGDNVTSPIAGGSAHGTHVAGSVLGRGTQSGGKYKGMAYGADLVFLKIGNNTTGSASSAAMNGAIKDAIDIYKANVISMSFGGWSLHHDGTDANCQTADYAASKGAVVVLCAGNDGGDAKHYRGTVNAGGETGFIKVNVTGSDGSNCTLQYNLVWYDGLGVHNDLTLQYYDSTFNPILTSAYSRQESTRGTEQRYYDWGDPVNYVPPDTQTYYIKVSNASTSNQLFHLYFEGTAKLGGAVTFASPDDYYIIESPGEADSVICVGSYNSRQSWTDYGGDTQTFGETLGQVSSFSSRGPRVDTNALIKPTIVAPGSAIVSCRDRSKPLNIYTISNSVAGGLPADYYVMQGTSMATPVTSGATALLLQAYPKLRGNNAAVRSLWQQTASRAANPDFTWGYGLINVQSAMNKMRSSNTIKLDVQGNQSVTLYTSGGDFASAHASSVTESRPQLCTALPSVFPYGLFEYDIDDLDEGDSVDITITMPQAGPTQYWRCKQNGWEQVPVIALNGNTMVIRLTDGGIGDGDNIADGDIIDFGGPALAGMDNYSISTTQNPTRNSGSASIATTTQPVSLPSISVQSATVSSTRADKGQEVEVKALVSNQGGVKGDASVRVYVNGIQEENLGVTVAAGQTMPVRYSFSRSEPGTYTIIVNNVTAGTVTVEDAAGNSIIIMAVFAGFILGILVVSILIWRRFRLAG